jgi:hypothetical protein
VTSGNRKWRNPKTESGPSISRDRWRRLRARRHFACQISGVREDRRTSAFDFVKSRNDRGPFILVGRMVEIQESRKNSNRRVHRHFRIQSFTNREDRKHAHFGTAKSKTPIRWKYSLWGLLMSFYHIEGRKSKL